MGTAEIQGALWGARSRDWADVQEPAWRPTFEAILAAAEVGRGTKLLDLGCGSGGALVIARDLGAEVAGLDASENLVALARERLPGARIEVGDLEQLPFPDGTFDVVLSINALQFVGDVVQALREASRVCRPGGIIMLVAWGRREDCEFLSITMPAVFALLPPGGGPPPRPPMGGAGVIEALMRDAGINPVRSGEITSTLTYKNVDDAMRAILSGAARTIAHAGEDAVRKAIVGTLPAVSRANGAIIYSNRFRWVSGMVH
jgi:SAM-dependent methyltransferase